MFVSRVSQEKIYLCKEIRRLMSLDNGDYVEYMIEIIHGTPHIYIKKQQKPLEPRILGITNSDD